jgi:PAS domain S-box-containing protein
MRELVEHASDGIFVADLQGRYTDVNGAGCRLLGMSRDEIVGKSIVDLIPPEDVDRLWSDRALLLAGGVQVSEWLLRRKDGSFVPVEVSAKILSDGRWQGFVRDISGRRKIERELRQAVEARDQILGVVAHDLRNPLGSALLAAGVLANMESQVDRREETRVLVERIQRALGRAARLIGDLLDMSSIEGGRLRITVTRVDPADLAREAVDLLAPSAAAAAQELTLSCAPGLPAVRADADRMVQVLANLVGNAVKFSPAGSHIRVSVSGERDTVRFAVTDDGPGIEAAQLPHVFDRFWQGTTADRRGTGLGLAIAKGLVEAHGGHLSVESAPGLGTTFTFTLPVAGPLDERPGAHAAPPIH